MTEIERLQIQLDELKLKLEQMNTQKVTLEYYLPNDEEDLRLAQKGREYYCALCDIEMTIRNKRKWDDIDEKTENILQELWGLLPKDLD